MAVFYVVLHVYTVSPAYNEIVGAMVSTSL